MTDFLEYAKEPKTKSATITAGQTDSEVIDMRGVTLLGIGTPATLTATALKLKAADASDGTFKSVYDADGNELSIAVSTTRHVSLQKYLATLAGIRFLKITIASSEGADRVFTLFGRPV